MLPVIQNRNLWAGISLITILLFTSGHMFNHIRKVPYVAGNGQGGVSYFAGGFSNQFGMETQIVAAMCKSFQSTLALRTFTLISSIRWHAFVRNHCPSAKSASHVRSQEAAISRFHLGGRDVWHVQLLAQRLQDQEWGLSFPLAAILKKGAKISKQLSLSLECYCKKTLCR